MNLVFCGSAHATARTWNNTGGTDFATPANWSTTAPVAGDVAKFAATENSQPLLGGTSAYSIAGFLFSATTSYNYDIKRSSTGTFTLTGYDTSGGSGSTNSNAAIRGSNTSGANMLEVPVLLAPASTGISTFYQLGGGTLVMKGVISGSGSLSLKGGGTIELDGDNSSLTGGMSIDSASETVIVGSNNALGGSGGAGAFSINSSATLDHQLHEHGGHPDPLAASPIPTNSVVAVTGYGGCGTYGGPDELIFGTDVTSLTADFDFGFGNETNVGVQSLAGGFYEVYCTVPVPEPATILGAMLLAGAAGWNQRRQLRGLAGWLHARRTA